MKTVVKKFEEEVEEIRQEMCDNYCRMPLAFADVERFNDMSDGDKCTFLEEVCDKCPLGRLI